MKLKYSFAAAIVAGCAGSLLSRVDASDEKPVTIAALPFTDASADHRYEPLADAIGDILMARSAKATARADDLVEPIDQLARELVGQFSGKLPELTAAQIDQSPDANLHFMRGLGYYFAGMPEHATTQFLTTMAIDPGHAEARFYCGMNYFEREEFGHARIEFTRFLKAFGEHDLASLAKEKLQQCETALGTPATGGQR